MAQTTRERWLPVPGFKGHYEVSDRGRVASLKYGVRRLMKAGPNSRGYPSVGLTVDARCATRMVHTLVMLAFVGPRPDGQEVRHLDGDHANNRLSNLAYGSHADNVRDISRHGRNRNLAKTECPAGHAYDEANTRVDRRGRRTCRTCQRERMRATRPSRARSLAS